MTASVYPLLIGALAIAVFYACFYCITYYYIHFLRGVRVTQTKDSFYCPRCRGRLGEITPNCPQCSEKLLFPEKRP